MKKDIIGLIPAAGKGLRLGLPYPKELYPIILNNKYKPVAEFVFDSMREANIKNIVFVINETKHQLIGYFGNGIRTGTNISYVVQETYKKDGVIASAGLCEALDSAYHLTKGKTVCFGMPDTIIKPSNIFKVLLSENNDVTLALFKTTTPEKFGMVETDKSGKVLKIIDKPETTNLKYMWGCIVWSPKFTEYLHKKVTSGSSDFAKILNESKNEGMILGTIKITKGTYIDIGTPANIRKISEVEL